MASYRKKNPDLHWGEQVCLFRGLKEGGPLQWNSAHLLQLTLPISSVGGLRQLPSSTALEQLIPSSCLPKDSMDRVVLGPAHIAFNRTLLGMAL